MKKKERKYYRYTFFITVIISLYCTEANKTISFTLLSLKKLLKIKLVETEAAVQRCSVQKVFLQISQNSKETLTQVLSCELCQISKNIFLHTAPLVAASEEIEIDLK